MLGKTLTILGLIAPILLLVNVTESRCHNATSINGVTTALCTDEVTGVDFEYHDHKHGQSNSSITLATPETLHALYMDYLAGTSSPKSSSPKISNTLMGNWVRCELGLEGVCADDHVIQWAGSGQKFQDKMTYMLQVITSQTRKRLDKEPLAMCINWSAGGLMCISWVIKATAARMDARLLFAAVDATWEECQRRGYSTEFKGAQIRSAPTRRYYTPQMYCISNRANGCRINSVLNVCPDLPSLPAS